MARTKKEALAPSTPKELKDTLWKAADKLRGSMDASQYKDVVLGLVFLKYVSDAFTERREAITAELEAEGFDADQIEETLEDPDEYAGSSVFWVDPEARWGSLVQYAKVTGDKTIGQRINEAMDLLMSANPSLQGTLPRLFNRDSVDQRRLAELLDLLNSMRFTGDGASKARDLLGEVYEYFLAKFALAEGRRGGEFYTPASVVRVIVEMLQPKKGRVYDPCCGSGGMFVQAEKFLAAHAEDPSNLAVYGQENVESTWRMAKMNLAIHGLDGNLGPRWGDTFVLDYHAGTQMDYVMANPPFNLKDWHRREDDARWAYGVPPVNNSNYAWLQHIVSKLAPGGTAGVVMANGSMTSNSGGEGQIRAQLVENDLVACMIALPEKLFRSTGIPVCLWFFAKDKSAGAGGTIDRRGEVLFIDARSLGHMVTRAERAFSDEDIHRISDTYHAWRGMERLGIGTVDVTLAGDDPGGSTPSDEAADEEYADVPGFCRSVPLAGIKEAQYALTPGLYVGMAASDATNVQLEQQAGRLTEQLLDEFRDTQRLMQLLEDELAEVVEPRTLQEPEMVPLSSLAKFVNGKNFTKNATGFGRVVIRIAELNSGVGRSTVWNSVEADDENVAKPGDLLFAWSGSLTVRRWPREEGLVNQHIFKVIPEEGVPQWLVHAALLRALPEFKAIASDKATTMGHIQRGHLDKLVPVPSRSTWASLDPLVRAFFDYSLLLEREAQTITQLRDTLLPALIDGRLRVRDVIKQAEEVL